jgi:hypothetical protein
VLYKASRHQGPLVKGVLNPDPYTASYLQVMWRHGEVNWQDEDEREQ